MNKRIANRAGFTLIECLVAIVILGIGLVGVVGCLTAALLANRSASDTELAVSIAQDRLEDMRSLGFGAVTYDNYPATSSVPELHSGVQTVEITDSFLGNARLKRVRLGISWHSANRSTSRVEMETVIGNRARHA